MAVWHHECNGHELGQISGDGEEQGGLVCCSPWSHKEFNTTGQLKNNNKCVCIDICVYICIHLYIYSFSDSFHYRLLQDTEYSSLCYVVGLLLIYRMSIS